MFLLRSRLEYSSLRAIVGERTLKWAFGAPAIQRLRYCEASGCSRATGLVGQQPLRWNVIGTILAVGAMLLCGAEFSS